MTAGEVALATGIPRATVSSTLSRLTRTGGVTKADRGYQLSDAGSKPAAKPRAAKTKPPKARSKPTSARTPRRAADAPSVTKANTARTARGATKAKVLAALSTDGGLTASDVAASTGLGRGVASTTLSKLAKNGEVVKAERGYRLPG